MNTLESCSARQDVVIYPDKVADYSNWYRFLYEGYYSEGIDISNLSENEIEEKIKEYLTTKLKYEHVTAEDIEHYKISTEFMQSLKFVNKVGNSLNDSVELISYLSAEYVNEMQLIDSIDAIGANSPEFQMAIDNIRKIYTDKAATIVSEVFKDGLEKGSEKVIEAALPSIKIVDLGITVIGTGSGLTGHTAAAQDVLGYSMMCPEMVEIYEDAVEIAAENGYSESSMVNVKNAFSMMKQSMLSYYDAQIEYTDGYLGGLAGDDKNYQSYIKYERAKLEALELGQVYEPITYNVYKERYGIE